MAQSEAYLGIGSNVGDRAANLNAALGQLASLMNVVSTSGMYETEPVGFAAQDPFLNLACCVRTDMAPRELLAATKAIEEQLGRAPTFENGPRTIDIDILLFGDLCLQSDNLEIPHPRMQDRSFVLIPLAEIAPNIVHPSLHKSIRLLSEDCADQHWVRALDKGAHVSTFR